MARNTASRADMPCSRSAESAKSIIMIAFFFTMPISRITPINGDHTELAAADEQRKDRASNPG